MEQDDGARKQTKVDNSMPRLDRNISIELVCPECRSPLVVLPNGEECTECGWIDIDF